MIGKIIKNISNLYTVLADNKEYVCQPRGVFRKDKITPLVGDIVEFDQQNLLIMKILPRKNQLLRPNVANIDYCVIVTSLKQPDLSLQLLDKQITHSLINNIKPLLCFTKLDLATKEDRANLKKLRDYYEKYQIKTFDNQHLDSLTLFLQDKNVVLTG